MKICNAFVLRASAFLIAGCLTAAAQTSSASKPAGTSAKSGSVSKPQSSTGATTAAKTSATAAGDHPTEAEVKQMLNAMHVRQNDERMLKQIEPLLQRASNQAAMSNPNLDDADRKFMKDLQDEEEAKMLAPEFLDQIVAASVPAYMKNLTATDVRQITTFYNSPAGQHLQTALPDISKQALDAALPLMQQRARDVIADQQKRIGDYMAKKHPQPAGSAPGAADASGASGTPSAPAAHNSTNPTAPGSSPEGAAKSGTTTPSDAAPQTNSQTNSGTPKPERPPKH